ncbi:MAG: phenylalanine--tRNA ligase subunit beta, partial [Pseudomonadota bacterium]
MKFTLSWLKDHLETEATLEEIVDALNLIGLEVEKLDDKSQFAAFKIAKVLSAEKHPDADKLKVLMVDIGDGEPVQVVCGAPNAREGLVGAFAAPGTYVPGIDLTLSVGKIRGVESHGMMCSERELEMSDNHEGIIDLPEDAPVGSGFANYSGLDDPVIEIGITPNRPDALGVHGIARDLAAAGLGKLIFGAVEPVNGGDPCPVKVSIEEPELCPGFALRMVKGVKNVPSPVWLQKRLLAIGLRPINALVDITNYVSFDRGRPLHVFDAAKVSGNLVVRRARNGEEVLALDERTYKLTPEMCVISDDKGVESIAGIMGGEESGCDESTTDVLIESALWNPLNVARTGRDLGILSDARYRFERGVDPCFMGAGLELATQLVIDFCGGDPTQPEIVLGTPTLVQGELVGESGHHYHEVDFPFSETERLTGIAVPRDEQIDILKRLGFEPKSSENGETVRFIVPSWRPDVFGKADLVEEVMRIYGVNQIEPRPLPALNSIGKKILTNGQIRTRNAKRVLSARGMLEAVTWSFISKPHAELFGGGGDACSLANPISSEMSDMRPSLLPGLIAAGGRNHDRGNADVALFEVASTYLGDAPDDQHRIAGGIRKGSAKYTGSGRDWRDPALAIDAFDAKDDALSILESAGMDSSKVQIVAGGPDWYHPGRCGTIQLGPKMILGHFGEIHPLVLEKLDVAGPIAAFEVKLDVIPEP